MKILTCIGLFISFLVIHSVKAHFINAEIYNPEPIIEDLNMISPILLKDEFTNFDVFLITNATCSSFRVVTRDMLAQNISQSLETMDAISKNNSTNFNTVDIEEFKKFEAESFRRYGANESTIKYLRLSIDEHPKTPRQPPKNLEQVNEYIIAIEEYSCDSRTDKLKDINETASSENQSIARSLGKLLLGVGFMAVNGEIALVNPTVGIPLTMASGGWGWNRVEEFYFEIRDIARDFFE